jgi:phosphatidylserine decarboxylase
MGAEMAGLTCRTPTARYFSLRRKTPVPARVTAPVDGTAVAIESPFSSFLPLNIPRLWVACTLRRAFSLSHENLRVAVLATTEHEKGMVVWV